MIPDKTAQRDVGREDDEGETDTPSKLSLISWNIDGLDGEKQPERARGLCSCLTSYSADVVLLQELVPPYCRFLKNRLSTAYTFIEGGKEGYYTAMLLKKSRITLLDWKIIAFPTTRMARNLLVAQVLFKGQKLCLMTSHLESCKPHAGERMRQLQLLLKKMTEVPDDVNILFGGDTNLRDAEVARVGLPICIHDVWEQLGEPEDCRYTWDTLTNTNKDVDFICRIRFDRLYLRQSAKDGIPQLKADSMALLGLEKLECKRYISDHWGIYCKFSTE
uniref:Tyrosyl-DNA phosphodiesterase 2 n=1 Tax=Takifugu rubripes TaxID=31033 RepID=H2U0X2_TAKRU